jgi:hypothetical protein
MRFLSAGLYEIESVSDDKPEARHQLGEAIDEASISLVSQTNCSNIKWHNDWQHARSLIVGILNMF